MLPLIQVGAGGSSGTFPSTMAKVATKFLDSYNSVTGLFTQSQPAFTDISGTATAAQIPSLDASKITTGLLAPARGGVAPTPGTMGYFVPDVYQLEAAEGTVTIGANSIRIFPFVVQQTVGPFTTITIRQFSVATSANGSHYVSIFDSTGALVVAGKASVTGTGALNVVLTVSSTTLVPGLYFIAWGTDCTNTVTWISTATSGNSKFALLPIPTAVGFKAAQISAGAMATSIVVSSFTSNQTGCLIAMLA